MKFRSNTSDMSGRLWASLARGLLLFSVCLGTSLPVQAAGSKCKEIPWLVGWNELVSERMRPGASRSPLEENFRNWQTLGQSAEHLYRMYRAGAHPLKLKEGLACIGSSEARRQFEYRLGDVFFLRSLDELRASPSAAARKLAVGINGVLEVSGVLPFRPVWNESAPADLDGLPAGFHRGNHSIVANFERIPPAQWPLVFFHEIYHAIDPRLAQAITTYSELAEPVVEEARRASSLQTFDRKLLKKLDSWLLSGLDRGFLAEVRAWDATARFYCEVLLESSRNGHLSGFENVAWMDRLIGGDCSESGRSDRIFHFLDGRYGNPKTPPFNLPAIEERLTQLRAELRAH